MWLFSDAWFVYITTKQLVSCCPITARIYKSLFTGCFGCTSWIHILLLKYLSRPFHDLSSLLYFIETNQSRTLGPTFNFSSGNLHYKVTLYKRMLRRNFQIYIKSCSCINSWNRRKVKYAKLVGVYSKIIRSANFHRLSLNMSLPRDGNENEPCKEGLVRNLCDTHFISASVTFYLEWVVQICFITMRAFYASLNMMSQKLQGLKAWKDLLLLASNESDIMLFGSVIISWNIKGKRCGYLMADM